MKGIKGVSVPSGLPKTQRLALQRADAVRRREAHAKAQVRRELGKFVAAKEVRLYQVASNFGVAVAEQATPADIKAMPGGKPATVKGCMGAARRQKIERECLKQGVLAVGGRNDNSAGGASVAAEFWNG